MPGTLNVGGHDIITHSGDAGAGDVTVNVQNRLVLNSSGRVGIGTNSPFSDAKLVISKDNAAGIEFSIDDAVAGENRIFSYDRTSNASVPLQFNVEQLTVIAGGSERMRIDSSGNIWCRTTSTTQPWAATSGTFLKLADSTYPLGVTGSSIVAIFNRNTSTGTIVEFKYNGSIVGTISTNGTATSYVTSSDYRLKENITEITDGITRVKQLNPSRFNFISDPDKIVDGFIAHEVQGIVPEAISGEKDAVNEDGSINPQGIDQSKLVPLLTAALKEAISKIEALTARIEALENA